MTTAELQRQRRVADQSLTAHTSLAHRLRQRQRLLTIGILTLSVGATALAFAGEGHRLDLGFARATLPTWAGVLSTIVFVLALVDLVVRWGNTAAEHEEAARRLAVLKGQLALARIEGDTVDTGVLDLEGEYWNVMNSIARIPNRWFVRLKAEHLRKVEQSKLLDQAPTAPVWLVRLRLWWTGVKKALSCAPSHTSRPQRFLEDERGSPDEPPPT